MLLPERFARNVASGSISLSFIKRLIAVTVIVQRVKPARMQITRNEQIQTVIKNVSDCVLIASLTLRGSVGANMNGAKRTRNEGENTAEITTASAQKSQRRRTENGRPPTGIKGRPSIVAGGRASSRPRGSLRTRNGKPSKPSTTTPASAAAGASRRSS